MHRFRAFHGLVGIALLAGLGLAPGPVDAQANTFCPPGQSPTFDAGFATLSAQVGDAMGQPITCEFPDPNGSGDVQQKTSTGLAFWRQSTNTPTFTDGFHHWGLTPGGLVSWTGGSIDPPQSAVAAAADFSAFSGSRTSHGASLDMRSNGAAFVIYRIYMWCNQGAPQPCDVLAGNQIIPGGQLTLQFNTATSTVATGQVAASTDPMYPVGARAQLTLLPSDAVGLQLGGSDFATFCAANSPLAACGA